MGIAIMPLTKVPTVYRTETMRGERRARSGKGRRKGEVFLDPVKRKKKKKEKRRWAMSGVGESAISGPRREARPMARGKGGGGDG